MDRNIPEVLRNICYIRLVAGMAMLLLFIAVWIELDFSLAVAPLVIGVFFFITSLRISFIAAKGNYCVLEGVCTKVIIKRHFTSRKRVEAFLVRATDGAVYFFYAGPGATRLVENSRLKVYVANDQGVYIDGNWKLVGGYLALWIDQAYNNNLS